MGSLLIGVLQFSTLTKRSVRSSRKLPAAWARGKSLTLLDDLLGLLPDTSIAQKPPLSLLANLALQVMFFWDLSVHQHIHNTKQQ